MNTLDSIINDLVVANRILAAEEIVDAFGRISVRHPERPDRYFLSRSRAPQCVEPDDIMEFSLDGEAIDARGRAPYFERFIHGGIYLAWPEARSVVHSHSRAVIPFSVSQEPIPPAARLSAAGILLDRGWGKPQQDGNVQGEIRVTLRKMFEGDDG